MFETAVPSLGLKYSGYFTTSTLRYLSLAIDSHGRAHVSYTPEFREPVINGYSRPFDQLAYATNQSGA